jgi:hypothetical protein
MSNHHCEAYTASPKALILSHEKKFTVEVFSFHALGTTSAIRNGQKNRFDRGLRTGADGQWRLTKNLGDPTISLSIPGRSRVNNSNRSMHEGTVLKTIRATTRYRQAKENEVRRDES